MRPLLPFATLLGTAFLLGCQDPGPVGPEGLGILLDKEGLNHTHGGGGGGNDGGGGKKDLVGDGEDLFFNATFGGNGRTCGTCHQLNNNLALDVAFITELFEINPNDPLFVADNIAALMDLESRGETGLLRMNGLILENIQGGFFGNPFFRAPPSMFNLSATAPYGLSGNVLNLRDFAVGAVKQHFPQTLTRNGGADMGSDFNVPTESELDALEAFMLSLESQGGNFKVSGPKSLLSTPEDKRAQDRNRPEVAGRDLFVSVGCAFCHVRTRAFSGNNFNTGVEALITFGTGDTGDGTGAFQTPGLFGLRKAAFFHNNAVVGLRNAVAFYDGPEFKASPERGRVRDMTEDEIGKITAFLEAIKCPLGKAPPNCT